MKTLMVYYSNSGNNELLALHLQQKLHCEILKIEAAKRRSGFSIFFDLMFNRTPKLKEHGLHLEHFDHFIFVAPIWAGKIASPLRAFLQKEKSFIKTYAFITFCGGGSLEQLPRIRNEVETILGTTAGAVDELWVTRLPGKSTLASSYRATSTDLQYFEKQLDDFISVQSAIVG